MGNTFSPQAAQCGQLIEAYSVMVTVALGEPIAMSGSDTGFATWAARALWARAGTGSARAARRRQRKGSARRMINESSGRRQRGTAGILGCGSAKDHGGTTAETRLRVPAAQCRPGLA